MLTRSVRGDEFAVPSDGGQSVYPLVALSEALPERPPGPLPRGTWCPRRAGLTGRWWAPQPFTGAPLARPGGRPPPGRGPLPRSVRVTPPKGASAPGLSETAPPRCAASSALLSLTARRAPVSPRPRGPGPVPGGRLPTPDLRPPTSSPGAAPAPSLSASAFHFSVFPSLRLKQKKTGLKPLFRTLNYPVKYPINPLSSAGRLSLRGRFPVAPRAEPGGASGRGLSMAGRGPLALLALLALLAPRGAQPAGRRHLGHPL